MPNRAYGARKGKGREGEGARRGRGWVPASARTTDGEGMDSRPRLHGGGLLGEGEGVLWGGGTGDHKGRPTEKGIKGKGILCWG